MNAPLFNFDNSYARELEGMSVAWPPAAVPAPRWLYLNRPLADELGLDADALNTDQGLAVFAGNHVPEGAQPVAQAYAGHQFGGFSAQLGDGRALLLGEILNRQEQRRDIAFKGSGRTPFSRGGDGKAAIGPVLREVLISEAMHALGIPTTRSLAAVATGETVQREVALPGAVLTRVAASHIRVGTFQFFAARRDTERLRLLAEYAIARHDPTLLGREDRFVVFYQAVVQRQARLVAQWMSVGFIHGVMNTDNMTISGETIDYGPCAFMEAYDPQTVFSSIDTQGRYAFGNQPGIAQWNLARLAEALMPLFHEAEDQALAAATRALDGFAEHFSAHWLNLHRLKLGLRGDAADDEADRVLVNDLLQRMREHSIDFTLGFRQLTSVLRSAPQAWLELWGEAAPVANQWLHDWQERLTVQQETLIEIADRMDATNPLFIPRNHLVESALDSATKTGDLQPFERLLAILTDPYTERDGDTQASLPGSPEQTQGYRTFCGT